MNHTMRGIFPRLGTLALLALAVSAQARDYTLNDGKVELALDAKGCLVTLRNVRTG